MINELEKIIITEIKNSPPGRITFADYMNLALYHREYGYYNSGAIAIGKEGDFYTSSSLGQDFGELLAIQFQEMWHNLGCPSSFSLVEMGAGNGNLAGDILNCLQSEAEKSFLQALRYIIIEQSPNLRAIQREKLDSFSITWTTLAELSDRSIEGCFFSNELVDAFPVHLVVKKGDRLSEVCLSLHNQELTETLHPLANPKISQYFDLVGINLLKPEYPPNYRTEVNLQALDWLSSVANKLKRGYLLTIDYGYTADKYYRPSRSQGTLQCYFQHRHHNNPYANLGRQDITAHVDFTALQRQGELSNLETLGYSQQGLFLMALGLGDRLNDLSSGKYNIEEIFQRRNALHQLIDPTGMGNFGVLIQGKNLIQSEKTLTGLTIPPMF